MKIAALISGRIFNDENISNIIISSLGIENIIHFYIMTQPFYSNLIEDVKKIYNPKDISINDELYFNVDHYKKGSGCSKHGVMCMYRSRLNLCTLFENYCSKHNETYDIVIALRMDIGLNEKIKFTNLLEKINNNILCIPDDGNPCGAGSSINDRFAIGNFFTITNYLKVYNSIYNLLESGILLHPERLLMSYLNRNNLKFYRFKLNYQLLKNRFIYEGGKKII